MHLAVTFLLVGFVGVMMLLNHTAALSLIGGMYAGFFTAAEAGAIGALFFSRFPGLTRIPYNLTPFLESWEVHRSVILGLILLTWFVMGMLIV